MMRSHSQKAMFLNSIIPLPSGAHVQRVHMENAQGDKGFVIEAVSSPPGSVTMRLVHNGVPLTLWDSFTTLDEISDFIEEYRIQ